MKNRYFSPKSTLRLAITWLLLSCMLFAAAIPALAAYPKNDDGIADEAGVLSEGTIRTIKQENQDLSKDLGVSIAVCTVKTTGETSIDEYARGLFKSWKLGEGILLLIVTEDKDYYFVPSSGTEKVLTSEVLTEVRDNYLEEDFASGNIDRGVLKTVSRLSALLVSGMEKLSEQASESDDANADGTTVGSFVVGFFKFILWAVLILGLLFVVLFVVAMFNDDVASLLRKYIFQRGKKPVTTTYEYDERLYGSPRQGQQNPQKRRPPQNAQQAQRRSNSAYGRYENGYPTQSVPRLPSANQGRPTYYNADGTPRRNGAQQDPRAAYGNPSARPANRRPDAYDNETRQFTIPTRNDY